MFKIGEIVQLRKLPDSCNTCTQLQECRAYVGGYFDAHEIEYLDATTADIDDQFYGQGRRLRCIQSTIKVPLEDLRYNHEFIKPGIYIVDSVSIDYNGVEEYEYDETEVKQCAKDINAKEFKVEFCEVHEVYSKDDSREYLRSELWPLGEFTDPVIQELYEKYEGVIHLNFPYNEYTLHRIVHGFPEKDDMSISL